MLTKRIWIAACAALTAVTVVISPALAEEDSLVGGARKAGRAIGSATREVFHGAKKVGKEIGHGAAKAGKAVGGAATEGARELKRAVKGD